MPKPQRVGGGYVMGLQRRVLVGAGARIFGMLCVAA
jgi:hypothetical protein